MNIANLYPWFRLDILSGFVALAICLFSVLILIYSFRFIKQKFIQYYTYIILTAIGSIGVVLSNHLVLLLVFWGFLALTLYLLINMGDEKSALAAKKTFVIVGGSDALMLLGIVIIYHLTGTFQLDKIKTPLNPTYYLLPTIAYLCIAIACFAKVGAMPLHSWVPDCAQSAPVPVVAYLPASLDKLLGIYLLTRISLDLFVMNEAMNIMLMLVGAFTIIAAVMMALIQQDMKRLLSYLAISGAGYMILGIGSGSPVGIAGGLFYMLNSAIWTGALFLSSGAVEYRNHTSNLDQLGGLVKSMPITFISCLIAGLSISGVPPFNGFVSKWMVYQGLISQFTVHSSEFIVKKFVILICLLSAMFGSALTLASFMKLIHAVFLGQLLTTNYKQSTRHEVLWTMWFPPLILAGICVLFGIFAYQLPLKYFILPVVKGATFIGTWSAGLAAGLIIIGLVLGLLIFKFKGLKPILRQDVVYVGGERWDFKETKVSGTEFYNTIKETGLLSAIYKKAQEGLFDIYKQGKKFIFSLSVVLQYLHNGILPTYLVWCLLGMLGLFYIILK